MENILQIKHFSFAYPEQKRLTLTDIDLGRIFGVVRPLRLRKIYAAAAAENGVGSARGAAGGNLLCRPAAGGN